METPEHTKLLLANRALAEAIKEIEALKKERDELAAQNSAMMAGYETGISPRAKALLECVEKAKEVSRARKPAIIDGKVQEMWIWHLDNLDKALAGLDEKGGAK